MKIFNMKNYIRFALIIFGINLNVNGYAQDTLWINTGDWHQSQDTMSVLRFNDTPVFDTSNVALNTSADASLFLTVINMDTEPHDFGVDGIWSLGVNILPNDTTTFEIPPMAMGTYRYFSSDLRGVYLGLSGVLKVGLNMPHQFHWNLADCMPERMDSISSGGALLDDEPYVPRYFSINAYTYPHTALDANGYVSMALGDTCTISIVNSGMMDHVLHFHGFHVEYLSSTIQTSRIGWSKDTTPLLQGEAVTLLLIANQEGMYPVHNHNLIAVTNSGFYPGGMITLINITP
ncbi:MAG: multicopper oxidase domain-containing protein [Flavobacteriales bacterium]|nr:multicopper oxidase domain-containing protein [Flavobacteriales bacterium]